MNSKLTQNSKLKTQNSVFGRPVFTDIDLSAVTSNAQTIKSLVGPHCMLAAVVKANGYGLGAVQIGNAAIDGGASWLAVACVDEGVQLRRAGIECPILVMSYAAPEEASTAIENRLTLVVHRENTAAALEAAAAAGLPEGQAAVHIKVDTGLGRFGCLPEEFLPLARFILDKCPHLRIEGLMTHFADADAEDLSFARLQLKRFDEIRRQAAEQGITFDIVHAANSAATLALPEARFDMVRVGIMLSGHHPSPSLRDILPLTPAVTLRTQLARVFNAPTGGAVGYGRTWTASRPSTIGLMPVGYADGFVRILSNRASVLVSGKRCPVVGRISMDQSAIDLTGVPSAQEGDEVVIIGKQGSEEITTNELAQLAGTISYEILSGLTTRVTKRYIRDGQVMEVCGLLGCS